MQQTNARDYCMKNYDLRAREIIKNLMDELLNAYIEIEKLKRNKNKLTWKQIIHEFINKKQGRNVQRKIKETD